MNREQWIRIERDWKEFLDRAQVRWNRLSYETLAGTLGRRESVLSNLVLAYGIGNDEAERQLCAWQDGLAAA